MVWRDLGLNVGLPDHWWTLYPLGQWANNIVHHYHHQVVLIAWIYLALSLHLSLLAIVLGRSSRQHPVLAQWCKFLLVSIQENIGEHCLCVNFCFPSMSWEVSDHTAAFLWSAASRICSKQHATSCVVPVKLFQISKKHYLYISDYYPHFVCYI